MKKPLRFPPERFCILVLDIGRGNCLKILELAAVQEAINDLLAARIQFGRVELGQFLAEEVGQDLRACIVALCTDASCVSTRRYLERMRWPSMVMSFIA